ncbi:uncharacterized protein LOC121051046 [Rosa chinensis]|uniref:uncharacterized protein LOC121051046 n=1 Tax=Rosa chinensis TaxID=74649 RepID=UPI001AD91336|nr:uncharacterized protein LOC121051046 [Rosa chinensis]
MGKPNATNAYSYMYNALKRKWNPHGPWHLIDLPNDFYIVKFNLQEDMNVALFGGPWILAGQTLVVQQWRPDFNPNTEKINKLAVWVRVLGLPVRHFKQFTLSGISKILGDMVKIDKMTLSQSRGISLICFNCGCYGHAKASCPHFVPNPTDDTTNPEENVGTVNSDSANSIPAATTSKPDKSHNTITRTTISSLVSDMDTGVESQVKAKVAGHGPWMLMSYKNKKVNSNKVPPNRMPTQSGSRYALLETYTEGDNGALREEQPTAVETLVADDRTPEPVVVSKWKQVQQKMKKASTDSGNHVIPPKTIPQNKNTTAQKKPLKDITNGKAPVKQILPRFNIGSGSSHASSKGTITYQVRKTKISNHHSNTGKSNSNASSSSVQDTHPQVNIAASFGHCPPENNFITASCTAMDSSGEGTSSNGQVCSALANEHAQTDISETLVENTIVSSIVEDMVDQ